MPKVLQDSHGPYIKYNDSVYRPQWSAFTSPYCINPGWRKGMKANLRYKWELGKDCPLISVESQQPPTSFKEGDRVEAKQVHYTGDCYVMAEGHDLERWHSHGKYPKSEWVDGKPKSTDSVWEPMEVWLKEVDRIKGEPVI